MINRTVSVITPTHNRRVSLQRLLDGIAQQDYPLHLLEVVVVADACTDDTITFLQSYRAEYVLKYAEQPGLGAANARNYGAGLAGGEQLIFLDDDIEPSVGMVRAHVASCEDDRAVVVGYLPMELKCGSGFYQIMLTAWWENKYHDMACPGYRHQFEDLLSGNFSLMASLFHEAGGFNGQFRCREDYEFGYRLINAGARIGFCRDAWGYHRDEVTNQARSHQRKRMEGYWDVAFAHLHPEAIPRLRLAEMRHPSKGKALKLFLAFYLPFITDTFAFAGRFFMTLFEALRMRKWWQKTDEKLHAYWYMRGVGDHVKSRFGLKAIFSREPLPADREFVDVDLAGGVDVAAREIDLLQARSIRLHINGKQIGKIITMPGEEIFRGEHLVYVLNGRFAWELMEALVVKDICLTQTGLR